MIINVLLIILAITVLIYIFNMEKNKIAYNNSNKEETEEENEEDEEESEEVENFEEREDNEYIKPDNTIVNSQKVYNEEDDNYSLLPGPMDISSQPQEPLSYNDRSQSIGCPVKQTDNELKSYFSRLYGLREMTDKERTKTELCNHIDFRGKTNASSDNFGRDPVDRINNLYLSGNTDVARRHGGKSIRDVYDGLTSDENLVVRHNVRLPDFERQNCSLGNRV